LDAVRFLLIAFITQFFYGNTLGEEVGWRGFALPRLQARSSPLTASLVLALFWFAWHLPLKVINPDPISYLFYGSSFIPQTILLTWLFNRTEGSILAVGIVHVMTNVVGKYLIAPSYPWFIVQFILAAFLILMDRMWKKLPADHSAVCASPEQTVTWLPA
jgi:membrane protease YdiL (CAAX protease family)